MMQGIKHWGKEIVIVLLQGLMFFLFPALGGLRSPIGMVLVMLEATLVLGGLMGALSGKKVRFLYPALCALMFLPTVMLFYNESAFVHALWYAVVSAIGLGLGCLIRWIAARARGQKRK